MSNVLKEFKKKPKKIKLKAGEEAPQLTMPDMYTLNKQLMVKEPPLSADQIQDIKEGLYLNGYIQPTADYILLCRERYDFTAFRCRKSVQTCIAELIEILCSRGELLSVDQEEDGSYECWVKIDDDAVMYKFFKCDWIIDC